MSWVTSPLFKSVELNKFVMDQFLDCLNKARLGIMKVI